MTRHVLVDTAVLAYVYGGDHEYREPCREVLVLAMNGQIELHASVEMVQEFLFHRMRKTSRSTAVRQAREVARLCTLHDFDARVLEETFVMIEAAKGHGPGIGGRDAVHAATAITAGLDLIVSPDRVFDQVASLTRIDPRDLAHLERVSKG